MRRPTKPCDVGDTITLHDRHLDADVTTLVDEVRWDSWLYGGEYRIFTPVGLYFTGRDIVGRTPDLLADLGDWSHEPPEREP